MEPILESIFVPESSLQGSEFPIHLTWQPEKTLKVTIEVPNEAICVKAIHNVDKKSFEIKGNTIRVVAFERNGYLGLIFETKLIKERFFYAPLKIKIETNTGLKQVVENKILLFRQDLTLCKISKTIDVKKEIGYLKVTDKILLRNEGKGTAVVRFRLNDESKGIIKKTPEIEAFSSKFCFILTEKYALTQTEFPKYCKTTVDFLKILLDSVQGTYTLNKQFAKKWDGTLKEIDIATQENEEYLRSLLEGLFSAYLASVHLITEVHGLLEYLKSLGKNKIILQSATSVIELEPGENKIDGCLELTDLAGNIFDPLRIQTTINVHDNSRISIPLYSIFNWLE